MTNNNLTLLTDQERSFVKPIQTALEYGQQLTDDEKAISVLSKALIAARAENKRKDEQRDELRGELGRLFQYAYDKLVAALTADTPYAEEQTYWQGRKDGLRLAIILLRQQDGEDTTEAEVATFRGQYAQEEWDALKARNALLQSKKGGE